MTWFKINRNIFDSDIWNDVTTFRLFILLIGKATHQDGVKVSGLELKQGQYLRSYRKLAEDLEYKEGRGTKSYSVGTISKCVDRLVKSQRVSKEETEYGTLFTVLNYAIYQGFSEIQNGTVNGTGNEEETNGKRTGNNNKNYSTKELKNKDIKSSRKQVFDDTSNYYQLANYFYEQIKINNPDHKQPNFQTWSDDIRKMIELDKRTEEQVKYIMRWVQQDDFEMANVLSPAKIRKRFDQLIIKIKQQQPNPKVTPLRPKQSKYNF